MMFFIGGPFSVKQNRLDAIPIQDGAQDTTTDLDTEEKNHCQQDAVPALTREGQFFLASHLTLLTEAHG